MNTSNTKKTLLVIATVVVVLIVIFAVYAYGGGRSSQNSAEHAAPDIQQTTQSIIASGNAAQCSSVNTVVGGVNYQTVCQNNIAWNTAQANLDVNACNGLDNKLMSIASCQNAVIVGLIDKEGSLSVCNQFTGSLNASCVSNYWYITASKEKNPSLCANLLASSASSSQAALNCEDAVLTASVSTGTSTPSCALYTGTAKTDCMNYVNNDCTRITFPPLQQACLKKSL
jgi:hypothetical protein